MCRRCWRARSRAWRAIRSAAANVTKLVGQPGYRLRVGDWRVMYDVDSGRVVVRVLRIGPRGGVYE